MACGQSVQSVLPGVRDSGAVATVGERVVVVMLNAFFVAWCGCKWRQSRPAVCGRLPERLGAAWQVGAGFLFVQMLAEVLGCLSGCAGQGLTHGQAEPAEQGCGRGLFFAQTGPVARPGPLQVVAEVTECMQGLQVAGVAGFGEAAPVLQLGTRAHQVSERLFALVAVPLSLGGGVVQNGIMGLFLRRFRWL